jgi:hypothetical protein
VSNLLTVVSIGDKRFLLGRMLMRAFRTTAADIKVVTSLSGQLRESDPTAAAEALLPMARVVGAVVEDYREQSGAYVGCSQMSQSDFVAFCDTLDYRMAMSDLPVAFGLCMSGATPKLREGDGEAAGESLASAPSPASEATGPLREM